MREMSGWTFLTYYGIIWLIFMLIVGIGYPLAESYAKPIAALIFPIAGSNSVIKNLLVTTGMYWGMVAFYALMIQKVKLNW
jgi:hypothetical protein